MGAKQEVDISVVLVTFNGMQAEVVRWCVFVYVCF